MTSARKKFQKLLRELFQIKAAAELDFGIYRIMGQKREVIERFIEEELLAVIESELKTGALREEANVTSQLAEIAEQIRENIDDDAIDAEGELDPAHHKTKLGRQYLALQQKAAGAQPAETHEATIYNHLYHFFSRYFDKGDFMSLRRYSKREKYAIPYNGEEVHLHWANADQYYIKTGETFTDYRWKDPSGSVRVRFAVTKADVPKDNIKAPDKRFFLPQFDGVTVETIGKARDKDRHSLVTVPFHYRGLTAVETETWETVAADRKLKNGNNNGGKLQAAVLAEAHDQLPNLAAIKENQDAQAALIGEHHRDADSNPVSRLAHHLRRFTVKSTSDYFIHKDLGGFLTRELDFFLKNEVLQLDALEASGEARAEGWFQMMQVIRRIGGKIIEFLAQIENFQKRLFEKKKFVTECHYCLTLDRVPESLYAEVAKNKEQVDEWKKLFAIEEVEGWSEPPTLKFLKANRNLVVDTKCFGRAFLDTVLSEQRNVDEISSGIVTKGDNFNALSLLSQHHRGRVSCAYADPPYNTGNDGFLYKDAYAHSSWLSFLNSRATLAWCLLSNSGYHLFSCDENEHERLVSLLRQYPATALFHTLVWKSRNFTDARPLDGVSLDHEYVVVRGRSTTSAFQGKAKDLEKYKNPDGDPRGDWLSCSLLGKATADLRPNLHYSLEDPDTGNVYDPKPETGWICAPETMQRYIAEKKILWPKKPGGRPRVKVFQRELKSEFMGFPSIIDDVFTSDGTEEVKHLFGHKAFAFPKPSKLLMMLIGQSPTKHGIILDYFGGSGTTAHAVIEINRSRLGSFEYSIIEFGSYFDSVLLDRTKKIVYGRNWKDGKPVSRDTGISHCFKYLYLESYEDALGNIAFNENEVAQRQLNFDEYCIHYMLAFETGQSETLLDVEKLTAPFDYKLEIRDGEESTFKNVDLPETFSFLIGLRVRTRKVYYRTKGRQQLRYLVLRGRTNPHATGGEREVVVIWRTTKDWKKADFEADKKFVEENELMKDADEVFVNSDSFIKGAKSLDPVFKRRMFNEPD